MKTTDKYPETVPTYPLCSACIVTTSKGYMTADLKNFDPDSSTLTILTRNPMKMRRWLEETLTNLIGLVGWNKALPCLTLREDVQGVVGMFCFEYIPRKTHRKTASYEEFCNSLREDSRKERKG